MSGGNERKLFLFNGQAIIMISNKTDNQIGDTNHVSINFKFKF